MSKTNTNHQKFFESFFNQEELDKSSSSVEINGWVLLRHWDGNNKVMRVDVFSSESYSKMRRGQENFAENKRQIDFLNSI